MEKFKVSIFFVFTAVFFSICCKKTSGGDGQLASLNIIQAAPAIPSVSLTFSDTAIAYYLSYNQLSYGTSDELGISPNSPYRIVSSLDTIKPLLQGSFNLKVGKIYSYYLFGQGVEADNLLMEDSIPVRYDSTSGIRFINLSEGSAPITINLQGNPASQPEFSSISYKSISSFKSYAATNGISDYVFEIRDQASGNLLYTFEWDFILFNNYTAVISGLEDPSSLTPLNIFLVNNF